MSDQEREYWLAGGTDLERAKAFIAERGDAIAKMQLLAKSHGGIAISNGRRIAGLTFGGDAAPNGWVKKGVCEGKPFFLPKRSSKALRSIGDELAAVRMKGALEFHSLMCSGSGGTMKASDGPGFGMRVLYASWEWIDDELLLSVPIGSKFTPDGSTKLAMSEYWAMKEKAGIAA